MKVTGWTDWDDPVYRDIDSSGYNKWDEAREIVIEELRNRGYRFSGFYHQYGDCGVPVIDNAYLFEVTQRSWGFIMQDAYPDEVSSYLEWAWDIPEGVEMVVPRVEDYEGGGDPH